MNTENVNQFMIQFSSIFKFYNFNCVLFTINNKLQTKGMQLCNFVIDNTLTNS